MHKSIPQLILHLKIIHSLNKNSLFQCKQGSCCRDLIGLNKFRQHLIRHHSPTDVVNNTNPSLYSTETGFLQELSIDVSHSSVSSVTS